MTQPFPFETERHQDETAPSAVHPTDFVSTTDPALDPDNNVFAGKRWRKQDSLATPTWFEIYVRNEANDAWIKEHAHVLGNYTVGQVPTADANGRLTPTTPTLDATLTALAGLDSSAGLVEQTGADAFTKRALGVGTSSSVPTRADADTRYAAASHTHAQSDITGLTAAIAAKADTTYVDAAVAGLSWKQAVRVATAVAGTLATSFENGDTVDGVTLATNDRILIKNQAAPAENGIYKVNASGAPTRTTDADSAAEVLQASVYVQEGTANADTQWVCTTNAPITLNTTGLVFAQLTSGGGLSDGDKGDITVSSAGGVFTIDNDVVTYAKMQNVSAASRILARKTSGSGDTEECTLSEVLDFIGSAAQGDILYRGASGWSRLGAGTSGWFLKTQGAGADPVWAASGGGVSLVRPTLVQYKATISEHTAPVLDSTPTPGNWLVWLSSTWSSPLPLVGGVIATPTFTWINLVNDGGSAFDGVRAFVRRVQRGEGTTINLPTATAGGNGQNLCVFEVAGGGGYPVVFDSLGTAGDPRVLSGSVLNDTSFMVGIFSNTSNSADNPTITGSVATVTEGTRATGTTSNGSPRQVNPFYCDCEKGAQTITADYAASQNSIAVAVVFPPALDV